MCMMFVCACDVCLYDVCEVKERFSIFVHGPRVLHVCMHLHVRNLLDCHSYTQQHQQMFRPSKPLSPLQDAGRL